MPPKCRALAVFGVWLFRLSRYGFTLSLHPDPIPSYIKQELIGCISSVHLAVACREHRTIVRLVNVLGRPYTVATNDPMRDFDEDKFEFQYFSPNPRAVSLLLWCVACHMIDAN